MGSRLCSWHLRLCKHQVAAEISECPDPGNCSGTHLDGLTGKCFTGKGGMERNTAGHRRFEAGRDQWRSPRPPSCPSRVSKSTVQALWEASGASLHCPCALPGQEYTFEILHLLLQLLEDLVRLSLAEEDAIIAAEPLGADLPRRRPLRAGPLQPRPLPPSAAAIPRLPAGQFNHERVHGRARAREQCPRERWGEREARSRGKRERAPGMAAHQAPPLHCMVPPLHHMAPPSAHARGFGAKSESRPSPPPVPRCHRRPSLTAGLPRCLPACPAPPQP